MKKILFILLLAVFVSTASAEVKRFNIPVEGSPSSGRTDAPVTMVEFIDYQ